ncbi:MAG: proline racemase family protein [Firmicutes bacterium]|jgi:proline racemase|nr:proline racemase family protein [Bacillota bacterium]
MRFKEMIDTVDTHTGGEPTRIILSGIPKLVGNTVKEKRDYFKEKYDYIRTRLTYEPRGHAGMLCAAVVPPCDPAADFGIFYMDDVQYLDMCGHATIGVGTALQEIGLVPAEHKEEYIIETPAGLVKIKNNFKEDYVESTTIRNVNSYVIENEIRIDVDDIKDIPVNLAYGGNVFAIIPADMFGVKIEPAYANKIREFSAKVREACKAKGVDVTLVQWYSTPKAKDADLRVVHSSGYGAPDRSPGGTGTSAKVAWLCENGKLKIDEPFVHEGIVDAPFIGMVRGVVENNGRKEYITEITGRARITGFHKFVFDDTDELKEGFFFE